MRKRENEKPNLVRIGTKIDTGVKKFSSHYERKEIEKPQPKTKEEWEEIILDQDGHKCQRCDTTENLIVREIHSSEKFPELEFDLENGITLCEIHDKLLRGL